ncbi:MAG: conjugal transfer protein TraG N-terminal domain-containing protein [Alphaproteobacteria bacterium]|nr:conjugal transfer protein TraG N-terminal domain-containing protein [Alphaproteobacteria bacterium]MBP9776247.1 conjugal transfer protein TraG N-terminal domain-containing protein [Alphaproteobacteria bacterium]
MHVITTYGGGELFALVFDGIATLLNTRKGVLIPLINIGLMVGLTYVVVLMLFRSQLIDGIRWFLWVVVATHLIFLPKTRIHIHDPLNNYHRDVDNVPLALGAFASLVSQVGKSVTEQFEMHFTLPGYMPYHQTGTVFASAIMSQVGQFRIVDPEFKGNMDRFINQCVVYPVMIGNKYSFTELQNTPNIWEFVKARASPILGFLYKEGGVPGKIVTCQEGVKKLDALWAAEIKRATAIYGSQVQSRKVAESVFNTSLMGSAYLLAGAASWASSATDILRQEMMIKAVEDSSNNKLSELGSAANYAATKALLQQRSAYTVAGEIAARTLPLFKNVIEALSYALFIFIVVLALLPSGYKILLTYCGILVWTQLWAPLYAVLNLIMTLYGQAETLSRGAQGGLTLLNSSAIINVNADMLSLAAWLSVSIPFISYGILKQGAGAFVGLAQHLGSAMQSAASGAAAETVSGNISLGNISMGTQAYQNTTAFQHNTSPSYTASHFRGMNTSGIEQSTFADGTQSFQDQALSRLSVQIMGTENTSYAQQTSLNDAKSVAETKSMAASEATEASLQESTNFMSRVGKDIFSGEDFHKAVNVSEAQSLQNFKNLIKDIRQNTRMDETQAVEAAVGMSFGLPQFGIGASARGSNTSARQRAIDDATAVAKQTGYSENIEKVMSAAQSYAKGKNDTEGVELGKGAFASLNHAKSLREESSIAQSHVNTLSKEMHSSQGKSFIINKVLDQDVLKFIAHQPLNEAPSGTSGPLGSRSSESSSSGSRSVGSTLGSEQIGYERARRIFEKGGEERDVYLQRFQQENPQYSIQSINTTQEQENLTHRYEGEAQKIQASSNPKAQHQHHTQALMAQGNAVGLGSNKLVQAGEQAKDASSPHAQQSIEKPAHKNTSFSSFSPEGSSPAQQKENPKTSERYKGQDQASSPLINAQEDMKDLFSTVTTKIEAGKKEIDQKEEPLQKAVEEANNKSLVGTTLKNAAKSVLVDPLPLPTDSSLP